MGADDAMDFPLRLRGLLLFIVLAGCGKGGAVGDASRLPLPAVASATPTDSAAESQAASAAEEAAAPPAVVQASHSAELSQVELSWITDDYFAALIFHPRQIFQRQQPQGELREWLDAAASDLGASLPDLEQVCFLLGPPDPTARKEFESPVGTAWVFRFATAAGQQGMLQRFLGSDYRQQTDAQGRVYFKNEHAPMAICAPDETTVLLASERNVKKALTAAPSRSPLLAKLEDVAGRPDVVGAIYVAPVRPLLRQLATTGKDQPAPPAWVRRATEATQHLKEATLTVDLAADPWARLVMEAEDSQKAIRLEEMAQGYRGMAALVLTAVKGQWLRGEDAPGYAPLFSLASETLAGARTTRNVRQLVVEAPAPASMADLARILESALTTARRGAVRQERVRRMQLIGLALHNYHVERGAFPAGASRDATGRPLLSWRVHLLPWLGEQELYRQFRLDEPWNSPHNRALIPQVPTAYQFPDAEMDGQTRMVTFTGSGVPFGARSATALRDFADGASETILVVECGADRAVPWTQPDDLPFDPQGPAAALGAIEPSGFLALYGDGRVEIIRSAISPAALKALLTHAGNEPPTLTK